MSNKQSYNIIKNAKTMILSTTDNHIKTMQDSISADLLNLELSILHHNRIYDYEKSKYVREMFDDLSDSIDSMIISHKSEVFAHLNNLMRDFAKSISSENIADISKTNDLEKDAI